MKVEFLGTGGATITPTPLCSCRVCDEARSRGVPYSRLGPSIFIHGPNILIDTPEEVRYQLNRANIQQVKACLYSHWHPDHVMGRRVWEMNMDWCGFPPQHKTADIYIPQQVAQDFKSFLGTWDHLKFMESKHLIRIKEWLDGSVMHFGDVQVESIRLAEGYVYAFLFHVRGKRVLIAMDELFGWIPPERICNVDLAIIPAGIFVKNPLTHAPLIPLNHPVLKSEATFSQTLDIVKQIGAKKTILTHIEEPTQMNFDDLILLEKKLTEQDIHIQFAYDAMGVDV